MIYVNGFLYAGGGLQWQIMDWQARAPKEGICLSFRLFGVRSHRWQALKIVEGQLEIAPIPWLTPGLEKWRINLGQMKLALAELSKIAWLVGTVDIAPEVETDEKTKFGKQSYDTSVAFYITHELIEAKGTQMPIEHPVEITESLRRFRQEHPDPQKVAFVMMKYGNTPAHEQIFKVISEVLRSIGVEALRADTKQYHDDLFPNVLTYVYGCGFGVAVYERLETDEFNPNVSLEVGYLLVFCKREHT
jgi:hypothetical protein